ncbi:hypothetical protein [Pedobacter sp. SL55]|uniref:hypothetical protein n=1 Tax=Pedobacter sp. SL55 TaxID=2995161 RepID=UPI0022701977|nr:hypothetical protein [Pedobacter sp. SL55]WAC42253.1 hypothetical protein OVA16_07825 [Pedobacter sp. SL55]
MDGVSFYVRLLRQVQFGVVLPLCLLPLLVWTYFSLRGEPLDFVEYIRVDFGISAILIVLLNVFYVCRYFFELLKIYYQPVSEQFLHVEEGGAEGENEQEVLALPEPSVELSGLYKMVYFYHSNRVNWAINRLGEMKDAGLLMDELEALLPKSDFFRVQPGFIVHRKSITKPMKASSHRLLLYLNTAYHKALPFTEIKGKKKNYVAVSQRKVGAFRKWYEEK